MPCNSIQTSTVELETVDRSTLHAGLVAAGFTGDRYTWTHDTHRLTVYIVGSRVRVKLNEKSKLTADQAQSIIKRSYAAQVLKLQAQKYGWKATTTAAGQLTLTR